MDQVFAYSKPWVQFPIKPNKESKFSP
jgi:hypothetical protein